MKAVKSILVAIAALAVSAPAFAGRDGTDLIAHDRAVKKLQAQKTSAAAQRQAGSQKKEAALACRTGHPSERVRC